MASKAMPKHPSSNEHPEKAEKPDEKEYKEVDDSLKECPVCLQNFIHPVRLPCGHIFCFLCVKGAANQSKRCALCRAVVPLEFFNNPDLLKVEDLIRETKHSKGYQWFYEGRNGWWQYDERTSKELETKYLNDERQFDLLIAGFLYVIDLDNMVQIRRNDPSRRRRVKRDLANVPKKGVAGLKVRSPDAPPDVSRVVVGGQGQPDGTQVATTSTNTPSGTNVSMNRSTATNTDNQGPNSAFASISQSRNNTQHTSSQNGGQYADSQLLSQMSSLSVDNDGDGVSVLRHRHHAAGRDGDETDSSTEDDSEDTE